MKRAILVLAVAAALGGCGPTATESRDGVPPDDAGSGAPNPASAAATSTGAPTSNAAADESPSFNASLDDALHAQRLAEVIVDELIVRSEPGIGPHSEIQPGYVREGARLWLEEGPVRESGYEWYLAVAERDALIGGGAEPAVLSGWIAAGSREGEEWIVPIQPDCPDLATLASIVELSDAERVLCFEDESLEIEGWIPPVWASGGCGTLAPAWLTCFLTMVNIVPVEPPQAALEEPGGAPGWDAGLKPLSLSFPPGFARGQLNAGQHLEVTGHFNDPAARDCGFGGFPDATVAVPDPFMIYGCRGTFVVESLTVSD